MRALSHIDRVLLIGFGVLALLLLALLGMWHLHWRSVQGTIAAIRPHPGIVVAGPGTTDPVLLADWRDWHLRARAHLIERADRLLIADLQALFARGLLLGHRAALMPGERPAHEETDDIFVLFKIAGDICAHDHQTVEDGELLAGMCRALSPPNSMIAWRTWLGIAGMLDLVTLRLLVEGRVTPDQAERWQQGSGDAFPRLLAAAEIDHRYWLPAEWSWRVAMDPLAFKREYEPRISLRAWRASMADWWDASAQAARIIPASAAHEESLITGGSFGVVVPGPLNVDGARGVEYGEKHRLVRLAMEVLAHTSRDSDLPESVPGLDLAAHPDLPRLCYRCIGPDMFVIASAADTLNIEGRPVAVRLDRLQVVIDRRARVVGTGP